MADTILIIIGAICIMLGILGCLLPVLPGPLLSYAALLLLHFTSRHDFTSRFLVAFAIVTVIASFIDNVIPVLGAKRYDASKYGIWGSIIGLVLGMFIFPPFGIILGPVIGAWVGEIIAGKKPEQAVKAAWGAFMGFAAGTGIKLVVSLVMTYYFLKTVF